MGNGLNRFLGDVVNTFVAAPKKRAVAEPARELQAAPLSEEEENIVYETVAEGLGSLAAAERIADNRGIAFVLQGLTDDDMENPKSLAAFEDEQGTTPAFRLAVAVREVEERIRTEFNELAQHVQAAFSSTAQLNKVSKFQKVVTGLTSYAYIRSRLWKDGFRDLGKIFKQIVGPSEGATLLGHPIENGVHRLLVEQLGDLTAEPIADDIHMQLSPRIRTIIGFQPRRIADRETLSNHVYGLAIDINATWSPHIKSANTIEIIRRLTNPPIDFATPFLKPGESIDEVGAKLNRASEQIRRWLAVALPKQTQLEANLRIAETRAGEADNKLWNAQTDAEKAVARNELDRARAELDKTRNDVNTSWDTFAVNELVKEWGRATLENWERVGLFTIPIELAKQLKAHGFDWGAEWSTHKDVMHFDLSPQLLKGQPGDFPLQDAGSLPG